MTDADVDVNGSCLSLEKISVGGKNETKLWLPSVPRLLTTNSSISKAKN